LYYTHDALTSSAEIWTRRLLALVVLCGATNVSADDVRPVQEQFREESAGYDRLSVSVTGDTLTEVYLEHRRALEMEERGGARARVEAVEVQAVGDVVPEAERGFAAVALWSVGGTVTHFGHRHFRENRYEASVSVVPVDDHWKIRAIDVLDEERVR